MRLRSCAAFTLVELMAVVGIVSAVTAMLLPALTRAREVARSVRCASNLHQLGVAAANYAAQSRGRYPPNTSTTSPAAYWYDAQRFGVVLPPTQTTPTDARPGGNVYVCPDDFWGEVRVSYAMNAWASSAVDPSVSSQSPASGRLWTPRTGPASKLILFAEAYSGTASGTGWSAAPTVGGVAAPAPATVTTAGQRFGGAGGVNFNAKRWGKTPSELCYMRHRVPGTPGAQTQARGRLNVAYADGHVAAKTDADLMTPDGRSTGDSLWTPADLMN